MSGFLANLIARARGDTQAIRPQLASRFENDGRRADPFEVIIEEFPSAAPPPARPPHTTLAAQPSIAAQSTPDISNVPRPAPPSPALANPPLAAAPEQRPNDLTQRGTAVSNPMSDVPPRTEDASTSPAPMPPITIIRERVETRTTPPPIVPARVEIAPVSLPHLGRDTLSFVAQQQPQQPAPQQTIEVTIGRIEVRATQLATVPSRTPAPSPVMSLDAYLRARARGGR